MTKEDEMVKISPALLGADPLSLGDAIAEVEKAQTDTLHVDIMDGHFVRDISFGMRTLRAIRERTALQLDVHLQVSTPERFVDDLIDIGVDSVSIHIEGTQQPLSILRRLGDAKINRGIAINPETPIDVLHELFGHTDQIVVMTSNPGTSDFQDHVRGKIRRLRELLDKRDAHDIRVVADGGITVQRASLLAAAGADILVAASAVFSAESDVSTAIANLGASQ